MTPSRRHFLSALLATAACTGAPPVVANPRREGAPKPASDPAPTAEPGTVAPEPAAPDVAEPEIAAAGLDDVTLAEATAGLDTFALDLHRLASKPAANAVSSPLSVAMALAMVEAGARGETASQITTALHQPSGERLRAVAAELLRRYHASEAYDLSMVDRLFGDTKVAFEPAFLDTLREELAAPLESLDFRGAPEPSRIRINDWVAEQTHDRIRDLLPGGAVDTSTRLVLVNAIYFKAPWQHPFDGAATHAAPFFAAKGRRSVPTMHATGYHPYAAIPDAGVQLLELPYASADFAMVLVLPDARDGLAALERTIDAASLAEWIDPMQSTRVEVALPKFRIEMPDALRLRELLAQLGIERMFDAGRADLTGMAPASEALFISEGFHKAFIAVDESGTEAAAATAFGAKAGAAMPTDPPQPFACDHPFMFAIRDRRTGALVFLGHVADPLG